MPDTARPAPSTEAATFALTSSTFATEALLSVDLAEQRQHTDAHAGQEHRGQAGDDAADRGAVDLALAAVDEADGRPPQPEREHRQAQPAQQHVLRDRALRRDQVQ